MKILFIPHGPLLPTLRTRGEELAKKLAEKHEIYYLSWIVKYKGNALSKLVFKVRQHFFPITEYRYENLKIICSPYSSLYSSIRQRKLCEWSLKFNKKVLAKIVRERNIDLIINESAQLWDVSNLNVPYIYDIVDMPPTGKINHFLKKQILNAEYITCISHYISKKIKKMFNIDAIIIPNGVDIKKFKKARKLKKGRLPVIGFIGNHGWWSGVDFLLDVFKKIQNKFELWIVGGGSEIPNAKRKVKKESIKNVKFIGPVPKEKVIDYFKTIDIGVLPFEKSILTDAALPIKILEYSACRKFVVATNLEELKTLKFPNVILLPRKKKLWAKSIESLKNRKWDKRWDRVIKTYDWGNVAKTLCKLVEKL